MLKFRFSDFPFECGTDEAGRGCLAGPVTAAAVIYRPDFLEKLLSIEDESLFNLLNDSKQLTEKARFELKPFIEKNALTYSYIHIHNEEIDEINILNASMKAMQECILHLKTKPEYVIVDGNRPLNGKLGKIQKKGKIFTPKEIDFLRSIPNKSIIKGDSQFISIASASILAKTFRDEYMNQIHEEFPMYNWKKNKGYPTKEHRNAIVKYGTTKYHRMTFKLLPDQLKFDL